MAPKRARTTLKKSSTTIVEEYDNSKFVSLSRRYTSLLKIEDSVKKKALSTQMISFVRTLQIRGGRSCANPLNQLLLQLCENYTPI